MDTAKPRKKSVLIESEGLLFRGRTANHPTEIWDYPRRPWVGYMDAGPTEKGWGKRIKSIQADRLKANNSTAEHYMYSDAPLWSQAPASELLIDPLNLLDPKFATSQETK